MNKICRELMNDPRIPAVSAPTISNRSLINVPQEEYKLAGKHRGQRDNSSKIS